MDVLKSTEMFAVPAASTLTTRPDTVTLGSLPVDTIARDKLLAPIPAVAAFDSIIVDTSRAC